MGLRVNNTMGILLTAPEYVEGVGQSGRNWQKASMSIEFGEQYKHPVYCVAWGRTATLVKDMLLQRGAAVSVDLNIKSNKNGDWWRTDVVIEDIRYERDVHDSDNVAAVADDENIFVSDGEEDLPF